MIATKSDSHKGATWAIASVQFGTEEKLEEAIAADEARVVLRNIKRFVQWDTFDDSISHGINLVFEGIASKAIFKVEI